MSLVPLLIPHHLFQNFSEYGGMSIHRASIYLSCIILVVIRGFFSCWLSLVFIASPVGFRGNPTLKEKKIQRKCRPMLMVIDDDIESPIKIVPDKFAFFIYKVVSILYYWRLSCACCVTSKIYVDLCWRHMGSTWVPRHFWEASGQSLRDSLIG